MRLTPSVLTVLLILPGQLPAFQSTTALIVRHAEQDYTTDEHDPILSETGERRVRELVRVLRDVDLSAVYSTPLHRTRDTATPVARQHGLEVVETPVNRDFPQWMADLVMGQHAGETVLIVSHSNTVPAIVNALGGGPYEDLGIDEFDDLFVVTVAERGTTVTRLKYGERTP